MWFQCIGGLRGLLLLVWFGLAAQTNIESLKIKARQELQSGDYQASLLTTKQILALSPNDGDGLLNQGVALDALGRFREANAFLTAAARKRATSPVLNNLAVNLVHLNRIPEAAATWKRVLQIDSSNPTAKYNLGALSLAAGDWRNALARWKGLPDGDPLQGKKAQAYRGYAEQLFRDNQLQESLAEYRAALALTPDDPVLLIGMSLVLTKADQPSDALELLTNANSRFPNDAHVLTALGNVCESLNDWENAEKWYRRAVEADGSSAIAAVALGRTLQSAGRSEEGIRILRSAVQTYPKSSAASYELGNALLLANPQDPEGLALMEKSAALAPEKPEPKYLLAKAAASRSDFPNAIRWAEQAKNADPNFAASHYLLGTIYRRRGQPALAASEFARFKQIEQSRKAKDRDPDAANQRQRSTQNSSLRPN